MSNPILELAHSIANQPIKDASPAERLADALLEATRDNTAMASRYQDLYRKYNALCHEVESLRERIGAAQYQPCSDAYVWICSGCPATITRNASPPDWAVKDWLRGLGWRDGRCERCQPPQEPHFQQQGAI